MKLQGLTVEGFSRAAVQTFWRIAEMKLGFDLGGQPWEFMGTPRWFISHTHMDHLLALPAYVARRRMMKMEPPTVYLPQEAVDQVRHLLAVFSRLDRGKLPCQLVGMAVGDNIELSRELVVEAVRTWHTLPSLGYIVRERRKKLREEYTQLSEAEIRQLAQSGVNITREIQFPKVAYLGDSTIRGLDANPEMYRAEILILEMSFVAENHKSESLQRFGHIHLEDLALRRDKFQNKWIIASHFSTRYNNAQIEQLVRQRIPDMFDGRLKLWL
ncbi:MAG: metal-dependent hydrolase [Planctomycetaceae bacterium]|nr:metal-dependent hydrolase [Planctomycetaceae bacterium]